MAERKIIKTFTLAEPVEDFDGEMVTQIKLRKLRGKDLRKAGAAVNDMELSLQLLESMAGVSTQVVDEMDGADLMPILDYIGSECLGKPVSDEASANGATSSERLLGSTAGRQVN